MINRRSFLKGSGASAIAASTGVTSMSFAQSTETHPVLIVLFLRGGCDGLNMFPPISGNDRVEYEARRISTRIPMPGQTDGALDLDGQFGLHPAAAPLKQLFDNQHMAVVRATGNTVLPSRSHFDAEALMETGTPGLKGTTTGWLTRYFQSIPNLPSNILIPSLAVSNYTPTAFASDPFVLTMNYPEQFRLNTAHWSWDERQVEAVQGLWTGSSALEQAGDHALTAEEVLSDMDFSGYQTAGTLAYPEIRGFGDDLKMLAQLIKSDVGLRIAALDLGGFDTHDYQGMGSGGTFAESLMAPLSQGLAAFFDDLQSSSGNLMGRVSMVVQTEFGRRFLENMNNGTDHGYAADTLLIGGQVNGGQFYGNWPGLSSGQLYQGDDVMVTTDFRQVVSEVLVQHMNIDTAGLNHIFPNYTGYTPMGIVNGSSAFQESTLPDTITCVPTRLGSSGSSASTQCL